MSAYCLDFTLQGLPKMSNQLLRGHWRGKHAHAIKWKKAVALACLCYKPPQPLDRATLTLTRASSAEPDFDGLVSSFKSVIDGLVECNVLIGDKMSNIGQPKYLWEKCPPKKGHIKVRIEQITNQKESP